MTELFDSIQVEGVGSEVVTAITIFALTSLVCSVVYFAWKATCRRPLEFDMFLVEMHTMERRRLVEVLHIGPNYERGLNYTPLMDRLRLRAQQSVTEDGQLLSVSDTNIIIQAPSNIADPLAQSNVIIQQNEQLVLWDIEMPPVAPTRINPARDSQIAAAAAITVLARPFRNGARATPAQPANVSPDNVGGNSDIGSSTIVRMQYMPPFRRRPLGHIVNYRLPVAVTLAREPSQRPVTTVGQGDSSQPATESTTPNQATSEPSGSGSTGEAPVPELEAIPPLPTGRGIQIRLKFLDDTQRLVDTDLGATVLQFKHTTFPSDMRERKIIRLIFRGKLMRDDALTLEAYGINDGSIVHCHISSTPYAQAQNAPPTTSSRPTSTSSQGQPAADAHLPAEADDRTNVWFFRVILSFLTVQLTSLPVQIRSQFQQFLIRHSESLRPSNRDTLVCNIYRRWYEYFIVPLLEPEDPVAAAAAAAGNASRPICIGNYLFWIFGIQCAAIWLFVSYFPQLCDRTALALLLLLTLYFFFVVVPMPYRRQPQRAQ